MKNSILLVAAALAIAQASASECVYNEVPEERTVYVVPLYRLDVQFLFDKQDKEALAQVSWELDTDKTRECFREGERRFTGSKLLIPRVSPSELVVTVPGALNAPTLQIFEEANGHFHGNSELVRLPYSSRAELKAAFNRGEPIVKLRGDFHYSMVVTEKKVVAELNCTEKTEDAGVIRLGERMTAIKNLISARSSAEKIDVEGMLQEFFGTCVVFHDVEANSLSEFEANTRKSSQLKRAKLSYKSSVSKLALVPLPAVSILNATFLDIGENL